MTSASYEYEEKFRAAQESVNRQQQHYKTNGHHQRDAEWPSPDWSILDGRRGTLPEFPIEVFGKPCREWLVGAATAALEKLDEARPALVELCKLMERGLTPLIQLRQLGLMNNF
jgi:hypothetical protein